MWTIQESRDELQRYKDQAETKGDELVVCRQQNAELEMRLGTLQVIGFEDQELLWFPFKEAGEGAGGVFLVHS